MATIDEPEVAFLIEAARQTVKRSSIRDVATRSRISNGAVYNLIAGKTRIIHGMTIRKLRAWYLREWVVGGDGLSPEVASYVLEQLLVPIRDEERGRAGIELLASLELIFDSRGTPRPVWLASLVNAYQGR